MAKYTTEITSDSLPAEKPLHERLRKAYDIAESHVGGDVLELGCGEGRGLDLLAPKALSYTAVDRYPDILARLQEKFPSVTFHNLTIPPLEGLADGAYDLVLSFQVIEHIKNDRGYLEEIARVLKSGGKALISTPNRPLSLSRNPWHVREYTADELKSLCAKYFSQVQVGYVCGNEKVADYHEKNRQSVNHTMRWDVLDLQHRLPAWTLRVPYEILNRRNRKKLEKMDPSLVSDIDGKDYFYSTEPEGVPLDLYFILTK